MHFQHSPAIWQQFPQLVAGLLVIDSLDPGADVAARIAPFFQQARVRLADATESDLPEVAAWRRAYSQMGMKPTQYRSAAESLLRRFRKEHALPQLHPLVDLCNAVSLRSRFRWQRSISTRWPISCMCATRMATSSTWRSAAKLRRRRPARSSSPTATATPTPGAGHSAKVVARLSAPRHDAP